MKLNIKRAASYNDFFNHFETSPFVYLSSNLIFPTPDATFKLMLTCDLP